MDNHPILSTSTYYYYPSYSSSPPSSSELPPALKLPAEILFLIFSHLRVTGLCRASRVCKYWNQIIQDESNWKYRYEKLWDVKDFENMKKKYRKKLTIQEKDSSTYRERYGVMYKCTFIWKTTTSLFEDPPHKEEKRPQLLPSGPASCTNASIENNAAFDEEQGNQINLVTLKHDHNELQLTSGPKINDEEEMHIALTLSLYFH
eukprot:TRINITY_DN12430_c0_g1_i1.p1 TRINITY_DN12430_c0_g1~~TRINITY_DN12430_c0_g1_i1.p1  ORF type:complete len:221 (-),score=45.99 TRINITY_DN12430_c0_g1_i1:246-857(-)